MTIEEIEEYLGGHKNIKLDFKQDGYFTVKVNSLSHELNIRTKGLLFVLGEFMTHEGRLLYKNNKPIKTITDIKLLSNITDNDQM